MSFAETTHHDEGVTITRSTDGMCVCLPRPVSGNHELGILAVLWDAWTAARKEVRSTEAKWTVDVCEFDGLTLPLISVISAISAELGQTGRKLSVVGDSHMPSFANNRTSQGHYLKMPSARIAETLNAREENRPSSSRTA